MARVAVFIASSAEIKKNSIPAHVNQHAISVFYTGLGKIRAAVVAQQNLGAADFQHVINLGTCGSHSLSQGDLVEVETFVERDVDLSAAGIPRGYFPGAEGRIRVPKKYFSNLPNVTCGSGDRIDLAPPAVLCDIYDMEGFSLAYVCQKSSLPFTSIKFVTDASGENIGEEWKKNRALAEDGLLKKFHEFLKFLP